MHSSHLLVIVIVLGLATACADYESSTPEVDGTSIDQPSVSISAPAEDAEEDVLSPPSGSAALLPALPGLDAYDHCYMGHCPPSPGPRELAAEEIDSEWARGMQDRVAEITEAIDAPTMTIVDIQCRTTWCGVVADISTSESTDLKYEVRDRLSAVLDVVYPDTFDFTSSESHWISVYIKIRR